MTPDEIKQARQSLGLTQSEMSRALGLTSVMTYSKWETGENRPVSAAVTAIKMMVYMHSVGALNDWLTQK